MSREEYQQDVEQRDDPGRNALGRCYWKQGRCFLLLLCRLWVPVLWRGRRDTTYLECLAEVIQVRRNCPCWEGWADGYLIMLASGPFIPSGNSRKDSSETLSVYRQGLSLLSHSFQEGGGVTAILDKFVLKENGSQSW